MRLAIKGSSKSSTEATALQNNGLEGENLADSDLYEYESPDLGYLPLIWENQVQRR